PHVDGVLAFGRVEHVRPEQIELAIQHAEDPEARRQHADDRARNAIDNDAASDDRRIGAELAPPESVRQQDDVVASSYRIVAGEAATERRLDAEHRKEVGVDEETLDLHRARGDDVELDANEDRRSL